MIVNDDILMSGAFTVSDEHKAWLITNEAVVISRSQPMINSLQFRVESKAGEPLSGWYMMEALAICSAMARVSKEQQKQ